MDHPFRSAALGGFNRQDVLDYLEKTSAENAQRQQELQQNLEAAEEERRQLAAKTAEQEEQLSILHRERDSLSQQLEQVQQALAASQDREEAQERELAALRRLSQRMLERINRNYRSILTINTSLLALGIFGILPPTTTALLHNASTMAISAASMRPYLPAPGGRGAQGKEPGNETA